MAPEIQELERTALLSALNDQRQHALGILAGLDEDALRLPVLLSGWTCLGMVQHLALDVERFWFRGIFAGSQVVIDELAIKDAWHVGPDVPAVAVFDLYRQECEHANAVITAASLDAPPALWPDDLFPDNRFRNLRQLILHVMTETATHAGHLDAARELIDGRQWLVL